MAPEREDINRHAGQLPNRRMDRIADTSEIWESDERDAHFILSRSWRPGLPLIYSLSVSGPIESREKVIADFQAVFGEEIARTAQRFGQPIEFVLWDAAESDKNRKKY